MQSSNRSIENLCVLDPLVGPEKLNKQSLCSRRTFVFSVIFGHIWGKYKIPSGLSPARGLCSRYLTVVQSSSSERMINSECGRIRESPMEEVPLELCLEEGRDFPQRMGGWGSMKNSI